jgi:hypothetical protein
MAATKTTPTKLQQDKTRAAIKTTQLVKRLQGFVLGECELVAKAGEDPKPIEIDALRLKAIEILLRKSLPDLSTVTLQGDGDNPVIVSRIELVAADGDSAD